MLSVRVGGPTGKELFRGFLNPGHELSYPLGTDVWMRIGRPQAVVRQPRPAHGARATRHPGESAADALRPAGGLAP